MSFQINWPSAIGWHKPAYCLVVVNKQGSPFWKTEKQIVKFYEQVNPFFCIDFSKMNSASFREKIECSLLDLVEVSVDVLSFISQLTEHMLTVTHVSFFYILPVLSQNFGQIL